MPTFEKSRGLWLARVYNQHFKRIFLGRFTSEDDAEKAERAYYDKREAEELIRKPRRKRFIEQEEK